MICLKQNTIKKREKKNFGTCMYNHNLIRLFLLNRIWISKTEIIINRKLKKKKKNMHHSLISFNMFLWEKNE